MPKLEPIRFVKVTTQVQWESVRLFAATFNHVIDDTTMTPLFMLFRGTRLFGYFTAITAPIISPAFHTDPAICTPRDFKETCEQVRAWQWLNTAGSDRFPEGQCWLALEEEPAISKNLIEKIGFKNTKLQLHQSP